MKDFSNLNEWTPKKLRTLRNNLNNRLESFSNSGEGARELQKSHMLHDMDQSACKDLLQKVLKAIKETR